MVTGVEVAQGGAKTQLCKRLQMYPQVNPHAGFAEIGGIDTHLRKVGGIDIKRSTKTENGGRGQSESQGVNCLTITQVGSGFSAIEVDLRNVVNPALQYLHTQSSRRLQR